MVGRGITPLWRRRQRGQFARAVDERATVGEAGNQTAVDKPAIDPDFADELVVVALLRQAAATAGPDEAARTRMRLRALGDDPPPPAKLDLARPPRSEARRRLAVAAVAALCLLLSLAGVSVLMSRDALPGDTLYGIKRTAESALLGFTFDEESRALRHLESATARITEMGTLVDRHSGDGPLGDYLIALTDFDADAAAGSRELTSFGANSDQRALGTLNEWAQAQVDRLASLRGRLPAQTAGRVATSLDLLVRIGNRAAELRARATCSPVTTGSVDEVGPMPAPDICATGPVDQGESVSMVPSTPVSPPGSARPGATDPTSDAPAHDASQPQPSAGSPSATDVPEVALPLPLPPIVVPPLLPRLPPIRIGG